MAGAKSLCNTFGISTSGGIRSFHWKELLAALMMPSWGKETSREVELAAKTRKQLVELTATTTPLGMAIDLLVQAVNYHRGHRKEPKLIASELLMQAADRAGWGLQEADSDAECDHDSKLVIFIHRSGMGTRLIYLLSGHTAADMIEAFARAVNQQNGALHGMWLEHAGSKVEGKWDAWPTTPSLGECVFVRDPGDEPVNPIPKPVSDANQSAALRAPPGLENAQQLEEWTPGDRD